ncbi:LLM class flavin-dependent oxidoreductase [Salirhabdus salicampi]|uniref:LLM class flavin-dependent oxidoreductase n=1 Tax=Salirhabdus salicampi TaxID=476102 RepID=UPI0020C568F2|nr:LLM class flavin-dependent oxidoreductase [Salirhabdus salicampi]MCP8615795.1 LLM class flavin-dependent oxidoreductase [Salirhabdus salicampi]
MKLSVLDQSVIKKGYHPQDALHETVRLAQYTEQLGYTRFWVAEHHNTNGIAGTSPDILISHIAANTERIKVGTGGVLLPQYSPYKVAENFKVLQALYPGRIDLGVGRSPGGNAKTRLALTDNVKKSLNEFPRQVKQLQYFLTNALPPDHPFYGVKAYPEVDVVPDLWLLGITHRGARVAAENGTAFTYGHFINAENGKRALQYYYNNFQASSNRKEPKANVCIFVVCADTEEKAEEIALSQDMWLLSVGEMRTDTRIVPTDEVKQKRFSVQQIDKMKENRKRTIIGTPKKVKEQLDRLSDEYKTDEFMIIMNNYHFDDKLRSYELIAEAVI